jgi:xylono-1,5-lactonase
LSGSLALGGPECVWPLAAQLGEGPVWHDGALWFVDIKSYRVHRFAPDRDERTSWPTPEPISFIHPTVAGDFVVGFRSGLYRFDPANGRFARLLAIDAGHPGSRLNDGAVDDNGYLWFDG